MSGGPLNRLCAAWCAVAFFWCMHDAVTGGGALSPGVNVFLAFVNAATLLWCIADEVRA